MHQQEILDTLLSKLDLESVEVYPVTLMAKPETIQARIGKDVERGVRSWDVWERSQQRLPLYSALKTEKVWTDGLSPEEAAEAILKQNLWEGHSLDPPKRKERSRSSGSFLVACFGYLRLFKGQPPLRSSPFPRSESK